MVIFKTYIGGGMSQAIAVLRCIDYGNDTKSAC